MNTSYKACRVAFYSLLVAFFASTRWGEYAQVDHALYQGPFPAPDWWLPWMHGLWILSLIFCCLGVFFRASSLLAFILGLYLLSLDWCFGNTHHTHHLIALCLAVWALAPEHSVVRMCQLLWCLIFFNAGLVKLRHSGLSFGSGENFQILLMTRSLYMGHSTWFNLLLLRHTWLASAMITTGLLLELLVPVAFFYPGWPRAVIVLGLAGLQLGAAQLMFLNDFKKMSACYVFWVPWREVALWMRAKFQPDGHSDPVVVLASAESVGPESPSLAEARAQDID